MSGRPHVLTLLPIAAVSLGLALSGCTPLDRFTEFGEPGAAGPTASESPTPTATPSPTPTTTDCDEAVLTEPGEYHLPDCVRVTVEGRDIQVNAGSVGTLIIMGSGNDVAAGDVGSLRIMGSVNDVDTLDLSTLEIDGRFNQIGVHGSVDRVAIDGNDNDVLADGDVGQVEDRGERNTVGSTP